MEEWLAQILAAVIIGAVVGGIARILLPGVQRIGVLLTIIIGAIAAYAGHFIAEQFAWGQGDGSFPNWPKLGLQVVLAMLVIGVIGGVARSRA